MKNISIKKSKGIFQFRKYFQNFKNQKNQKAFLKTFSFQCHFERSFISENVLLDFEHLMTRH